MATEVFLQNPILTRFLFPFLLVFFIVFALLQKTKILGDGKSQIDALTAFVIGLIVVAVAYPTDVINNLILFLTVALIVLFVGLLLWGFASGGEAKIDHKVIKWIAGGLIFIAVIIATLWATGSLDEVWRWLFRQNWSNTFWTNTLFIIVIAVALAVVLNSSKAK